MRTPGDDVPAAAGYLVSEGVLSKEEQEPLPSLRQEGPKVVNLTAPSELTSRAPARRASVIAASYGRLRSDGLPTASQQLSADESSDFLILFA